MTRFEKRYRKLSQRLDEAELLIDSSEPDPDLASASLFTTPNQQLFLDYYGDLGLLKALEHYKIIDTLKGRGLSDFEVQTGYQDGQHTMILRARPSPRVPLALISEMVPATRQTGSAHASPRSAPPRIHLRRPHRRLGLPPKPF
jgi:hypothetical protein